MEQTDELQVNDKVVVIKGKYEGMGGTLQPEHGYGIWFVLVETEGHSKPGIAYHPGVYGLYGFQLQKITA